MKQFELNGMVVHLSEKVGTIINSQKRSETKVTSSGGGSYVAGGTTYATAPTITSTTTTKHEFWVRTDSGDQLPVQLSGLDIPMVEGQRLGLVSAEIPGTDGAALVQVVNYSARSSHLFVASLNALSSILLRPSDFSSRKVALGLLVVAISGLFSTKYSSLWILILGTTGYVGYQVSRNFARRRAFAMGLAQHLESRVRYTS